jgi:hypothetical protein
MARIVWNDQAPGTAEGLPIEVHYGSPNELVQGMDRAGEAERLFLPTERPPEPGTERDLLVHVGFIGRTLRLRARAEKATRTGVWFVLLGPDGQPCAELRRILIQIRQGLAYQAARDDDPTTGERPSRERQIRAMPTTLKIMLALKADREDRGVLAGDPDPQVILYLLRNPKLGLDEIRSIAARPSLNHQHITSIAACPAWVNDDQVKLNLARNPRLPEALVETLLASLSVAQLKVVAGSVSTSPKARRVAHRILHSRGA